MAVKAFRSVMACLSRFSARRTPPRSRQPSDTASGARTAQPERERARPASFVLVVAVRVPAVALGSTGAGSVGRPL